MKLNSEYLPSLRPWNRKCSKHKSIRVGVQVETPNGLGIVTWRKGDQLHIAVKSDGFLASDQYRYAIDDVSISDQIIAADSPFYKSAWYQICSEAYLDNVYFELARQGATFTEYEGRVKCKRSEREISTAFSTVTYRRYTGVNTRGEAFDFEINITRPQLPAGDRILFALGIGAGLIANLNGHGRIYRRKIEDSDMNYGLAKYAAPQEEGI
jgi:hypothetical protein